MAIGGPDNGAGAGAGSGAKKQRVDEQGDGSEAVGADPIPVDRKPSQSHHTAPTIFPRLGNEREMAIGGPDDGADVGAGSGAKKQRVDEQGDRSEAVGADPIPVDYRPSQSHSTAPTVFSKLRDKREMAIGGLDDGAGASVGSRAKKQRVEEQGDGSEVVGADSIPVDRISALPDDLRRRILTHLALKEAIRTGALARGWRDLWRSRRDRGSVEVRLRSRDDPRRELGALEQEPTPRLRMDHFSLVAETSWLKSSELRRFIRYAADCHIEDLHVETRKSSKNKLNFHLPLSSRTLVCLSLRRISISNMYYRGAQPFRALEVIRLYSVSIKVGFTTMMELCPSLVTLDLRGCIIHCDIRCDTGTRLLLVPRTVKSVTIVECDGYSKMWLMLARNLRSFRYSGDVCRGLFYLPWEGSVLADLYIRSANRLVSNQHNINSLKFSIPENIPRLNVLTICCNALQVASYSLPSNGVTLHSRNLHSLRELQLLMLDMEAVNLADLYVFLKTCRCPNLERLFVQLPAFSNEPMEGPIDEVREEPPQDGFDNLVMVKVMNFNWRPTEVQLLSFLLGKASSLRKLLIVSPNVTPRDLPGVQDADLLLLKEALANGKITLSESDDATNQPYHSEAFIKF